MIFLEKDNKTVYHCCLSFDFRIALLQNLLPNKTRQHSLLCYFYYRWRRVEMRSFPRPSMQRECNRFSWNLNLTFYYNTCTSVHSTMIKKNLKGHVNKRIATLDMTILLGNWLFCNKHHQSGTVPQWFFFFCTMKETKFLIMHNFT